MSRRLELIVASVMAVTLVTFSIRQRRRRKTIPPTQREWHQITGSNQLNKGDKNKAGEEESNAEPTTGIKSIGPNQLAKGDKQSRQEESLYAQSDAKGLPPMNDALSTPCWECGKHLPPGFLPHAKEISESVACLQTILEQSTTFSRRTQTRSPCALAMVGRRGQPRCWRCGRAGIAFNRPGIGWFARQWHCVCDARREGCQGTRQQAATPQPSRFPVPKELRHSNLLARRRPIRHVRSARG